MSTAFFLLALDPELATSLSLPKYYCAESLPEILETASAALGGHGITKLEPSPGFTVSELTLRQDSYGVILGYRVVSGREVPLFIGELFWHDIARQVRRAMDSGDRRRLREIRRDLREQS
jgi:hypothetical protein